ncbi:ATP-binding domain-containing protein [Pendulispora albinea]|uniref:ATP-binding domain-containing protein n=1 Tax=Pendulispora albinea TaxID=2741071 RepID=A0ABZ2M917_9BACT
MAAENIGVRSQARAVRELTAGEWIIVAEQKRLAAAAREAARRGKAGAPPYFAHMRICSAGRARDVLLGLDSHIDTSAEGGITVVDYRRAPIAEVFFACEPGDEYEIEVNGRTVTGILERRHLVTFEEDEPSAITVPNGALRQVDGTWRFETGVLLPTFSRAPGQPLAVDLFGRGPDFQRNMAALLSSDQTALLERDPNETVLVLGAAGSGKTTVAIHRVASIARARKGDFDPKKALVIVPEAGLRHLAERMLRDLGLDAVAVRTFDDWIRAEARRIFPWLPAREAPETPLGARRIKRHPALFSAIDALLDQRTRELAARIDRVHAGRGAIQRALEARREPILEKRLERGAVEVLAAASPKQRPLLEEAFREELRKLEDVREDLYALVGDRALLAHAVRDSGGDLTRAGVEQTAEHTRRQLDEPSEIRFAHVDADRLVTLDGRSLDDGTPDAVAGTVDIEDYAVLFELLWRKTGRTQTRAGKLRRARHLVVDEAQSLTSIELRVLGHALHGNATIAGDEAQVIDGDGYFTSWDDTLSALGVRTTASYLKTSYRCPRPILDAAYAILGPEAAAAKPAAVRDGGPVLHTVLPNEGHAAVFVAEALRGLARTEPRAMVAVIAHDAATARAVHDVVARALPARLVLDGDFAFAPGVEITEVAQVKGLEFDYVIVPDANAPSYPDTPLHRRMLHVALTRAIHQVWILSPGEPSRCLAGGT